MRQHKDDINVPDIPPELLLMGLYNYAVDCIQLNRPNSVPTFGHALDVKKHHINREHAAMLIEHHYSIDGYSMNNISPYRVDYLYGICLKVDINGMYFYPGLYDREYGKGSAERVVARIRAEMESPLDIDPLGDPSVTPRSRGYELT